MSAIEIPVPQDELSALLEWAAKPHRGFPLSAATIERAKARLVRSQERDLEWQLRVMQEADAALPYLLEAERLGTYVRDLSVDHSRPSPCFVVAPEDISIQPVAMVLKLRGYPVQTVGEHHAHGYSALGSRLRPADCDPEARSVEESQVFLEGGRCVICGHTQEDTTPTNCHYDRDTQKIREHDFNGRTHGKSRAA